MLFGHSKERWPEPEKSVGQACQVAFRRTRCWQVTGPALDTFNKLAPSIDALLADNQEKLEQGEAKPRVIAFDMWMEGDSPVSAQPVLVFSSKSRRQRSYAKALLKDSGLLNEYPGISVKTLDRMPAVLKAQSLKSDDRESANDSLGVFMSDRSSEIFGARIRIGTSKLATALGTVFLKGKQHVLIPQHPRFQYYDDDIDILCESLADAPEPYPEANAPARRPKIHSNSQWKIMKPGSMGGMMQDLTFNVCIFSMATLPFFESWFRGRLLGADEAMRFAEGLVKRKIPRLLAQLSFEIEAAGLMNNIP